MAITRGSIVRVTTASGREIEMRAMGEPMRGRDFPVLWVCTEAEWSRATADDDEPNGTPWPVEDVKELAPA
jgi:hypothetical protein